MFTNFKVHILSRLWIVRGFQVLSDFLGIPISPSLFFYFFQLNRQVNGKGGFIHFKSQKNKRILSKFPMTNGAMNNISLSHFLPVYSLSPPPPFRPRETWQVYFSWGWSSEHNDMDFADFAIDPKSFSAEDHSYLNLLLKFVHDSSLVFLCQTLLQIPNDLFTHMLCKFLSIGSQNVNQHDITVYQLSFCG